MKLTEEQIQQEVKRKIPKKLAGESTTLYGMKNREM